MSAPASTASQSDIRQLILCIARQLGVEGSEIKTWYLGDPIATCGGATAHQLVARGEGERVVRFLLDTVRAEHRLL
ncbi:hypothetical protein [Luteimonas abyssi]|uniref:hypothetical protein n=1 Tax=Luteimonas abyssi TaxID=1247514 RepID=UPI000737CB9A|nr:hypothetical protein [Luteimonas abyssi]